MKTFYKTAVVLALAGMTSLYGYQKTCYLRPQYGRIGSTKPLEKMMGKCAAPETACVVAYSLKSADGRKKCNVCLTPTEMAYVKRVLSESDADVEITESMINALLHCKKGNGGLIGRKIVGQVLRDFKDKDKRVTVQMVRDALGINAG